jgi:hypothetical protein
MQDLTDILTRAENAIAAASDLKTLESIRVEYLGKNGHSLVYRQKNVPKQVR